MPGIGIDEDYIRTYPMKDNFSHILGYINKPNQKDMTLPFVSKMPNLKIGKSGIERTFNSDAQWSTDENKNWILDTIRDEFKPLKNSSIWVLNSREIEKEEFNSSPYTKEKYSFLDLQEI